ncbi:hypothetical protein EJ05DRAFT_523333 [Pseudovirgaria hyperparasitica]|uniref:Arrestin-like N-terminal domain-containing protein n=1 Tax=Pseudovirgaria hyperparasitica TaxID=470096 RepID=A0A6A6VU87_9PEZI|nr:uncharacterized protein EJ05DRAFT_523333 [Pseudovirgaria hyperparasitica]KAF2753180.1 hypothetical protein EJ05DRAFT_523333 [Pseudovirgaria hyperparasitica]
MIVSVYLEKQNPLYTNLDVVKGKVILKVPTSTSVSQVVVKLESECKTRLTAPNLPGRSERQRVVLEVHKLLYKTLTVWPPQHMHGQVTKNSFTLNAGQYDWPFEFKIPLNNQCWQQTGYQPAVTFGGLQMEIAKPPTQHTKQTLPPTLNGFPGEAEIRYFVKVTVARPQFYKENLRAWAHFNFLPIEPPPGCRDGEAYARRQHQFLPETGPERKKSIFGALSKSSSSGPGSPPVGSLGPPPRFAVDVRLPNPATLTCNDELPLRILLKQLSERTANVYLQMLQIELIGYTKVRAHEFSRTESNSWIVVSLSNMAIPIGSPSDAVDTETAINPEYWMGNPLPNTVAPSFETCSISRHYELEVRVGLGYGTYQHGKDQLVVLPLRLPVRVLSGIKPPGELLKAMEADTVPGTGLKPPLVVTPGPSAPGPSHLNTPVSPSGPPPPQGQVYQQPSAEYEDAPPSYEDAVGQNLPPIDGPRRAYAPPPFPEGEPRFEGDRKS